jgi:hypothetical protein
MEKFSELIFMWKLVTKIDMKDVFASVETGHYNMIHKSGNPLFFIEYGWKIYIKEHQI